MPEEVGLKSRRIRIGYSGWFLSAPFCRGLHRYTINLLRALHAEAPEIELHVYSPAAPSQLHAEQLAFVSMHADRRRLGHFSDTLELPSLLRRDGIDLYHCTSNLGLPWPALSRVPTVLTIHDLMTHARFRSIPFSLSVKRWQQFLGMRLAALVSQNASQVITGSQHSLRQILARWPHLADRIEVVPYAPDPIFSPGVADVEVLRGFNARNFLVYFGGYEVRKNVPVLIEAFQQCRARSPEAEECELLLVGAGALPPSMPPGVRAIGHVEDRELVHLLRAARCLIVPSLDEGFGLPLVEGMAAGCPVIASHCPPLKEVGGEAPLYFDPHRPEELSAHIISILADRDRASGISLAGIERARHFSWAAAAKETLRVYERALGAGPGSTARPPQAL